MKNKKLIPTIAISLFLSLAYVPADAQESMTNKSPNSDNTAVNTRDRSNSELTADQAENNLSDREVMQKIRKSVVDDKSLSTYAHNVKIISEQGKVTLKGPVRNDAERQAVEDIATEVAGAGNVTNAISVKSQAKHN